MYKSDYHRENIILDSGDTHPGTVYTSRDNAKNSRSII